MKKQRRPSFGQAGEILIEALLGLVIAMLIITGLIVALSSSVSNSSFSTNQSQATLIAKEGLDLVKNLKEDDYSSISEKNGLYYFNASRVLVLGCCENVPADNITFSRQIYIGQDGWDRRKDPDTNVCSVTTNPPSPTSVFAASIVSWWDSKCGTNESTKCHKIELDSCFADLSKI